MVVKGDCMKKIVVLMSLVVGYATADCQQLDWGNLKYAVGNKKFTMSFVLGDITEENYAGYKPRDVAIVNAANKKLLFKGGVSGAIFEAADKDDRLTKQCNWALDDAQKANNPIKAGDAIMMSGCGLKTTVARSIIFAVGPDCRIQSECDNRKELLTTVYQHALELADEEKIKDIRFPLISTNIFQYDPEEAIPVMIDACLDFLKANPTTSIKRICFVIYPDVQADSNLEILFNAWQDRQSTGEKTKRTIKNSNKKKKRVSFVEKEEILEISARKK